MAHSPSLLFVLALWIDMIPASLADFPGLQSFRQAMEADPGVNRALELQGMKN